MEALLNTLAVLLPNLPLYLVWIVGLVLAVMYRRRDQRVAILTAVALTLFLAVSLCTNVVSSAVPSLTLSQGWSTQSISMIFAVTGILGALIAAGAWIMILVAIFSGRD
jgi:FtsH-binding integral membrane protein